MAVVDLLAFESKNPSSNPSVKFLFEKNKNKQKGLAH